MFDQFFERPFGLGTFFGEQGLAGVFSPQLDVTETDKAITISAELPGLDPGDIDISLDRGVLTICGKKRAEKEEKGARYYRVERSYGSFYRSIPLPGKVEEDKTFNLSAIVIGWVSLEKLQKSHFSREVF